MTTDTQRVAQQIAAINRRLDGMRVGQLGYSSIDGRTVAITGGTPGNRYTTGYIGVQADGTTALAQITGPTPPYPSLPIVTAAIGGLTVRWDGSYPAQPGYISPIATRWDFLRIEVEVSTSPSFPLVGFGPVAGIITQGTGGSTFVPWLTSGASVYIRLRTRSQSGKLSDPGPTLGPIGTGLIQLGDLGFNIAQYSGGNTVYYTVAPATPTAPTWGFTPGDLWLYQVGTATGYAGGPPAGTPLYETRRWLGASWVLLQDQGINNSLAAAIAAQSSADAKLTVFRQATPPAWTGTANTAAWYDTANGELRNIWTGSAWSPSALGNGAIQSNSLIASNVIATGTVTAALMESVMVLATSLVAGTLAGDHSALTADGLHIFRVLALEGLTEVGRFSVGVGTYFGFVDAAGDTVAFIDDTGGFTGSSVITDVLTVGGQDFDDVITGLSSGVVGRVSLFTNGVDVGPIFNPYGLVEVGCVLQAGRAYELSYLLTWVMLATGTGVTGEIRIRIRHTAGSDGNVLTQPARPTASTSFTGLDATWIRSYSDGGPNAYHAESGAVIVTPNITSRFRYLLQIERGAGGAAGDNINVVNSAQDVPIQLFVTDLGPAGVTSGAYQPGGATHAGGGGPSSPSSVSQQYDTNWISPTSWAAYSAGGTKRTDTSDVVQGFDPSGFNGDGGGYWFFPIPSITGTVDRVDLWVNTTHTYFNSGGTAIWNIIPAGGGTNFGTSKLRGDWYVGGYPKVGSKSVTLPSDFWPFFRNAASPRAVGVSAGRSGGTNEIYYCRFDGPSARLRIWYTQ